MTISITDQNFNEMISGSDKPILVEFWASLCDPCKSLAPALEEASDDFADKIVVFKINVDDNPETSRAYGIKKLPTIVLFKEGKVHLHFQMVEKEPAVQKSNLYEKIEGLFKN